MSPPPSGSYPHAVVCAPQALGLGTGPSPQANGAASHPPNETAPPPAAANEPRPVRLPASPADHEGTYQGLLWAVRALDECGRAFTRLASRIGKVESRLTAIEQQPPVDAQALDQRLSAVEKLVADAQGLDERVKRLERSARPATSSDRYVAPPRTDPQAASLQRDLAAVQVRVAKLEALDRQRPSTAAALDQLEADVMGVYQELDKVAELVADRLAAVRPAGPSAVSEELEARLRFLEARLGRAEPERPGGGLTEPRFSERCGHDADEDPFYASVASLVGAPPPDSEPVALTLLPRSARVKAAASLTAELDRIRHSLSVLAGLAEVGE